MHLNFFSQILIHLKNIYLSTNIFPVPLPSKQVGCCKTLLKKQAESWNKSTPKAGHEASQALLMGKRSGILPKEEHKSQPEDSFCPLSFFTLSKGNLNSVPPLAHPTSKLPYQILEAHLFHCQESYKTFLRCGPETQVSQNYAFKLYVQILGIIELVPMQNCSQS